MINFADSTAISTTRSMIKDGIISEKDFEAAITNHQASGKPFIEVILEYGYVSETDIRDRISRNYSISTVDFKQTEIPNDVETILPKRFVLANQIFPYLENDKSIAVALADPSSLNSLAQVKSFTNKSIDAHVCSISDLESLLTQYFPFDSEDEGIQKQSFQGYIEQDVISFVDTIIETALKMQVSDIHIEPSSIKRVRFRKDGILMEQNEFSEMLNNNYLAVIARLKIISANVNVAETRLPQDSRINYSLKDEIIDMRISFLPTSGGERIVIRILEKSNLISLKKLGFNQKESNWVDDALKSSQGLILVTGPTGSGKTTTLYSMLSAINTPDINILTAEDPIEYDLEGISQVQVRENIGLTFASSLRTFLRQDPEVILVGEVRDSETADIAIKASLTGHLVLSTLHTNDAPSTITRLTDMGIPKYLIGSSLKLIIAQRLLRQLCTCAIKQPSNEISANDFDKWKFTKEEANKFKAPKGCKSCNNTGFSGRTSIFQIINVDLELKNLIISGASEQELEKTSINMGSKTIMTSGLELLKTGITSFSEIERVLSN